MPLRRCGFCVMSRLVARRFLRVFALRLAGDHGEERVAVAADPAEGAFRPGGFGEDAGLGPALGHQHGGHAGDPLAIAAMEPDPGSFLGKEAIAEGHDQLPAGPDQAPQVGGDRLRLLEVLPARHDQRRIHALIIEGERLVGVEVLHPEAIQPRIGLEFSGIEAMADHLRVAHVVGQVAHPAAHQIEHHGAGRNSLAVEGGEAGAEAAIQVLHKAGFGIEQRIVAFIELAALVAREQQRGGGRHQGPKGMSILVRAGRGWGLAGAAGAKQSPNRGARAVVCSAMVPLKRKGRDCAVVGSSGERAFRRTRRLDRAALQLWGGAADAGRLGPGVQQGFPCVRGTWSHLGIGALSAVQGAVSGRSDEDWALRWAGKPEFA